MVQIVYVLNSFARGGAEAGLATLLENGFLRGVDFRIFVLTRGNEDLRRRVVDLIGEERLIEVGTSAKLKPMHLLKGLFKLMTCVSQWRPHGVVLSLKQANIVGRLALLPFPATRCIAFEHIAKLEKGRLAKLYEFALKGLAFRVNEVWADCQATLLATRVYFPARTRRTERVVPLFICDPDPQPKADYSLTGPFKLVIAGRLIPRKRHDLILRAMYALKARGVETQLTLFGEGPEENRIRALAVELGLGEQVIFAGFHADWWRKARGYDVFIHPSDEEGFCIVAAEAMMAGLPTICTPVGGLCDFGDDRTVIFTPVGSATKCEDAIMTLLTDDALRERIGRAAAASIAARYSRGAMRVEVDRLTESLTQSP